MTEFAWPVPADHPAFAGHFPGNPIVPGVVILDRALLFAETLRPAGVAPGISWQVGNAKFLSPVGPDEVLVFSLLQKPSGAINFSVRSGERNVASGSLTPPAA